MRTYLVEFDNDLDTLLFRVSQNNKINRANNADDEDLINEYIRYHFGDVEYRIVPLDIEINEVYLPLLRDVEYRIVPLDDLEIVQL